jgi:hypothetical protein
MALVQSSSLSDGNVETTRVEDELTIELSGSLDATSGDAVRCAVAEGIADGVQRVAIDLRGVSEVTDEGVQVLATCRQVAADITGGLHYRSASGPGREVLLAALGESAPN